MPFSQAMTFSGSPTPAARRAAIARVYFRVFRKFIIEYQGFRVFLDYTVRPFAAVEQEYLELFEQYRETGDERG